jgi:hypothetical protein
MLIPNKFNGYQADGCRLLHVGGGVGEAALIGAAMGGGSAALTGGDPLKGALLGGLTGGIGGGLGGAAAGGAGGAAAGTAGGTAAGTAAGAGAGTAAGAGAGAAAGAGSAGITALPIDQAAANIMSQQPGLSATQQALSSAPAPAFSGYENGLQSGLDIGGFNPAQMTPATTATAPTTGGTFTEGMQRFMQDPIASIGRNKFPAGIGALAGAVGARKEDEMPSNDYDGPLKRFRYNPDVYRPQFAEGGITNLPVERMSNRNDVMAMMANGGQMYAEGGISSLGSYSDGGRMLKGPGDGMSDSIPANIAGKRPARLATEEFVVPADVVSHLGNGSSDAGAKQLYAMMDRVRSARTGTKKQGRQIKPESMMPA